MLIRSMTMTPQLLLAHIPARSLSAWLAVRDTVSLAIPEPALAEVPREGKAS